MKLIKLYYGDAELFETAATSARCDFIVNHFEAFMQMYRTQGSTFWLRFFICFKKHSEEKIRSNKIWITDNHTYFIWILNYIYIDLHKRFLEDSNTAVKEFIHNLIKIALNSRSHLKYTCKEWLIYIKYSKELRNVFKRFFNMSDSYELDEQFCAFLFTVYTDFFCALCAVFKHWYKANDLSEEELKKLDSEIIYWLPYFNTEKKIEPTCFDKYVSDYWKEDLQRMLLTDNIHKLFSTHQSIGCCEKFTTKKDFWKTFQISYRSAIELIPILNNDHEKEIAERNAESEKICTCCLEKETQVKMFKSCAILTQEKCMGKQYYCSRICFQKDWGDKHIEFSRQSKQ